jgi:hypothetical protein
LVVLAAGVASILRSGGAALGAVITLAALTAIALGNLYWNPAYAREDVRPVARMLRTDFEPNNVLIIGNIRILPVLQFYGTRIPAQMLYVEPSSKQVAHNLRNTVAELEQVVKRSQTNVWLIQYRMWEADPDHILQTTLDRLGRIKDTLSWPGVSLRIYGQGPSAANNSSQLSTVAATMQGVAAGG